MKGESICVEGENYCADVMPAAGGQRRGASAPTLSPEQRRRFRIACRMLRQAGRFDKDLPQQRRGESPIDWLCRLGLAPSPYVAAEMLIMAQGLQELLTELCSLPADQLPL